MSQPFELIFALAPLEPDGQKCEVCGETILLRGWEFYSGLSRVTERVPGKTYFEVYADIEPKFRPAQGTRGGLFVCDSCSYVSDLPKIGVDIFPPTAPGPVDYSAPWGS